MEELNITSKISLAEPPPLKIVNEASMLRESFRLQPDDFFYNHEMLYYFFVAVFFIYLAYVLKIYIFHLIWPKETVREKCERLIREAAYDTIKRRSEKTSNKCDQVSLTRCEQVCANVFDKDGKSLQKKDYGELWDWIPIEKRGYSEIFGHPKGDILTVGGEKLNMCLKNFQNLEIFGLCVTNSNVFVGNNCYVSTGKNCEIHTGNNCRVFCPDGNSTIITGDNCYVTAGPNCTIRHGVNCDISYSDNCLVQPNSVCNS